MEDKPAPPPNTPSSNHQPYNSPFITPSSLLYNRREWWRVEGGGGGRGRRRGGGLGCRCDREGGMWS
jgi:hypothetical protein